MGCIKDYRTPQSEPAILKLGPSSTCKHGERAFQIQYAALILSILVTDTPTGWIDRQTTAMCDAASQRKGHIITII